MPKPGIDELLIAAALQPDLHRRLLESPDETLQEFDLTEEQKDLLRQPDHRLLTLLGEALARQTEFRHAEQGAPEPQPRAVIHARTLPDMTVSLTVVPCAQYESDQLSRFAYAVWVNPLPEGTDPEVLPPPPGATFPGQPLPALHAVIQLSAVQLQDAAGNPQVGLWASLSQFSNVTAPPAPESAGQSHAAPFGSNVHSSEIQNAIAAVREATAGTRYGRLIDLIRALRSGDVR